MWGKMATKFNADERAQALRESPNIALENARLLRRRLFNEVIHNSTETEPEPDIVHITENDAATL